MKHILQKYPDVKAILFDSGKVLNKPSTGHWFITPNFFASIDEKQFYRINKKRRDNAFYQAAQCFNRQGVIGNLEEEFMLFQRYYMVFSDNLPELKLTEKQIEAITKDLVNNPRKYVFYKDAQELIPRYSLNYKLAVVSDAWPSLEQVFENADMRKYFSAMVISSQLGTAKPDKLMYLTALERLGEKPENAVFIDDNIKNCLGAETLGIKSVLLCRELKHYLYSRIKYRKQCIVKNLHQL